MRMTQDLSVGHVRMGFLILAALVLRSGVQCGDYDPVLRGQWPGYRRGFAKAVAVSGHYAYLAAEKGGLQVIDISNPANPQQVGGYYTGVSAEGVAVAGNYAYVADFNGGLHVIDISNPTNPQRVGRCNLSLYSTGVAVSGNYAYVANWGAGLQVIDISDPTNPQRVGGYDTSGLAVGVAVSGNYAYVADNQDGLQLIDISDPTNPQRVGGYDTSDYADGVAISGSYAYVGDGHMLDVIDISIPTSPRLVGQSPMNAATGVAVSGNYAYMADGDAGLKVVDISNPANPLPAGVYDTRGSAFGVAVFGSYAYVADFQAGLQVIDISSSTNLKLVGESCTSGSASDVAVSGNYAYVADGWDGLQVIEVSNLTNPQRVGGSVGSGYARGVAVTGNYAYVAEYWWDRSESTYKGSLVVIDIANAAAPKRVGKHDTLGPASEVALSGNYAYLGEQRKSTTTTDVGGGLSVIDISNPTSPRLVGGYDTGGISQGVTVSGNYAYVADSDAGLQVIDISNPSRPWLAGRSGMCCAAGVAVSGKYAYLAVQSAGLAVIDISNPANPRFTNYTAGVSHAYGVAVSGNYAYVTETSVLVGTNYFGGGLRVIDVSSPTNPRLLGRDSSFSDAYGLTLAQGKAFVTLGNDGLAIFDVLPFFKFKSVTHRDGQLELSWEGFGNALLQKTANLTAPDWQTIRGSETTNSLAVPLLNAGSEFFRLVKP